jgi:hypothetical protein
MAKDSSQSFTEGRLAVIHHSSSIHSPSLMPNIYVSIFLFDLVTAIYYFLALDIEETKVIRLRICFQEFCNQNP